MWAVAASMMPVVDPMHVDHPLYGLLHTFSGQLQATCRLFQHLCELFHPLCGLLQPIVWAFEELK